MKKNGIREKYDRWSQQYDTDINRTRDIEKKTIRALLRGTRVKNCLEAGCGTGKNTPFLAGISEEVVAFDFSDRMLEQAKRKVKNKNVIFVQGDLNRQFKFPVSFDLVAFSLVLEHIRNLPELFRKLRSITNTGALVYIGEIHPFRQYKGSGARFSSGKKTTHIPAFTHHITDYTSAAEKAGFSLVKLKESFDAEKTETPRLIAFLFRKE